MPSRALLVNRGRPDERIFTFTDNTVYTTKYSIWTFIPKFLFEQFSRYANLFFLAISLIQQLPGVTPFSRFGTALPLGIIIIITGIKEVSEDFRRKAADDRANNSHCEVFHCREGIFEERKWATVKVGDLVRVQSGGEFPADLVLIDSSMEERTCYVETSNIDGETNLKLRESVRIPVVRDDQLKSFHGLIKCDQPNNRIYEFGGVLIVGDSESSLTANNLLLRGSKLENTEWIVGIVVYTGKDTKLVMNSQTTRIKRSSIELMTNKQIINLFLVLLAVVTFCTFSFYLTTSLYSTRFPYLFAATELTVEKLVTKFFTFLVLMNNLVPISLIMTMEMIRIRLGTLIDEDMEIYDELTDTPAIAKTTSLIEELGQVTYVFSDKTGTLTKNEMLLRQLCARGKLLSDVQDNIVLDEYPGLDNLLLIMSTCNTAVVGHDKNGHSIYQSSSPDEVAIADAAASMGYVLKERKLAAIKVQQIDYGESTDFDLLATLEFDSARKRMSVILKDRKGKFWLFAKGADTIMWPRLATGQDAEELESTSNALNEMALTGLRTLVFGYKELTEEEFRSWMRTWEKAQTALKNRKEEMDSVMDSIEQNLILAGVSGVEDRLQDLVPETIQRIHAANIRLWVLTGDKMETAVNIGYSCKLLNDATQILQITSPDGIQHALEAFRRSLRDVKFSNAAIVIEAKCLQHILEDESLQQILVDAARPCRTVLCCRVSPSQKAKVVEVVQKKESAVCLAIGDGANDVGMIQAAQIGVGISGREGLQAARSADFSIAQFRFLQKLILVHGIWGYHRISRAAVFCVYKNILLYAAQIWFAFVNLFSGQTIFETWMVALYNVCFTAWPPIVLGLTDQLVTAKFLLAHPSIYKVGQENRFYNSKAFWQSAFNGFAQSFIAFVLTAAIFLSGIYLYNGAAISLFFMGTTLFAALLITGVLKAALLITYWTTYAILGLIVCPISWALYIFSYDWISVSLGSPSSFSDLLGMSKPLFTSAVFWLSIFLIPFVCLVRDFIWKFYQRQFIPQEYHIIQELQREEKYRSSRSRQEAATMSSDIGFSSGGSDVETNSNTRLRSITVQ